MSHIAASFCAGGNNRFAKQCAGRKHGPARDARREHSENSNAPIARPLFNSGFIAAIPPPTVEIFSLENQRAGTAGVIRSC